MKRTHQLLLFAALIMLVGCREMPLSEEVPASSATTVYFHGGEALTKTSFGEKDPESGLRPLYWSSDDKVGVTVNASADYQAVTVSPSADARYASFSASLDLPAAPYKLQAVSPASALVAFDGSDNVTLSIPASQTPELNGPDAKAQMLVAEAALDETPTGVVPMQFHHATAYGCLSLANLPTSAAIQSIDLVFDVPVTGKWDYSFSAQTLSAQIPANILTLHTDKTSNVYFACAPADLQGTTLKIRLNTADDGIYERSVTISGERSFKAGVVSKFTVDMSTAVKKTSISILVFGHSYAQDALAYLLGILEAVGYTDVHLGFLMYGNCSLEQHVAFYSDGTKYGLYQRRNDGKTTTILNNVTSPVLLDAHEWEYVSMQHEIVNQAIPSSFQPHLDNLVDIVRQHVPQAQLLWHSMWPHREGDVPSTWHYESSEMYEAIVSTTRGTVLATGHFAEAIPSGTAIQNLKQTHIGWEALYRDRIHLSYEYGRFAAGLTWGRKIGRLPISGIAYKPSYDYSDLDITVMKWAAESAFTTPWELTPYVAPPSPSDEPDPGTGSTGGENFTVE